MKSTPQPRQKQNAFKKRREVAVFSADLHANEFHEFRRYARPSSGQPSHPSVPELSSEERQRIAEFLRKSGGDAARKAAAQRKKLFTEVLQEFDSQEFSGPRDFYQRRTFKDALRAVLAEFLQECHIVKNEILLPSAFQLSGSPIGGFHRFNPRGNVLKLVVESLVWRCRKTLGLLWSFSEMVDHNILDRIAEAIVPLVKAVNEAGEVEPSRLGDYPKTLPFWPLLVSDHKDFTSDKSLLKRFGVGADFPFPILEESRWTARDPIGKWAMHLCQDIEIQLRSDYTTFEICELPEFESRELEAFSTDTWEDWWKVIRAVLQKEYIDVVEIPALNRTVRSPGDRKSAGRIRKRIFQALKDKIKSMARANKSR